MRRAASERARTLRIWRAHLRFTHSNDPDLCACELQPGRFRKTQRIAGCLRPRCWACKYNKLADLPTRHQFLADLAWYEECREQGRVAVRPRVRLI